MRHNVRFEDKAQELRNLEGQPDHDDEDQNVPRNDRKITDRDLRFDGLFEAVDCRVEGAESPEGHDRPPDHGREMDEPEEAATDGINMKPDNGEVSSGPGEQHDPNDCLEQPRRDPEQNRRVDAVERPFDHQNRETDGADQAGDGAGDEGQERHPGAKDDDGYPTVRYLRAFVTDLAVEPMARCCTG